MKTSGSHLKSLGIIAVFAGFVFALGAAEPDSKSNAEADSALRVHEWGTFTTLHWPSGTGLSWYQNTRGKVSELPSFVHGLRVVGKSLAWGQHTARMETPVLYFYTDKKQVVDLEVSYQGGMITEYYPAKWKQMELIPPNEAGDLAQQLPIDEEKPHNHYYEARAVPGAAFVRSPVQPGKDGTKRPDEVEKFVFYRGVGSFNAQLYPRMQKDGVVSLSYYHRDYGMDHVWVVQSSADAVRWTKLPAFAAYDPKNRVDPTVVRFDELDPGSTRESSIAGLKASMLDGLTEAGLTADEAVAMVATWDKQWYDEPGQRVFTIPSQRAIDPLLPIKMNPKPSEIVRVFVHRQELLSPETLQDIELALNPATDPERAKQIIANEQLGRFVHGALGGVADDVSRRTRNEYYSRGLAAVHKEAEWIDLGREGAQLYFSADIVPTNDGSEAQLSLATEDDAERCRIKITEDGKVSLGLFKAEVDGATIDRTKEQSLLLRIISHTEKKDEVFLKISDVNEAASEPKNDSGWTLVNRDGHSNADLTKVLLRHSGTLPFRNIRVSHSLGGLASSPAVVAETIEESTVAAADGQ